MKTCENGVCLNPSHRLISADRQQIRLGLLHFCNNTASLDSPKDLEFLMFQTPSSIESSDSDEALITVYAVHEAYVSVSRTKYNPNPRAA